MRCEDVHLILNFRIPFKNFCKSHVFIIFYVGTIDLGRGNLVCENQTALVTEQTREDRITITNPINTRGNQANFGTQHNYAGANIHVTPVLLEPGTASNDEPDFTGKNSFCRSPVQMPSV